MVASPTDEAPPIEGVIARLPPPPRSLRTVRYDGADRAARLSSMRASDREGLVALYDTLCRLDASLSRRSSAGEAPLAADVVASLDLDGVLAQARGLGRGQDALPDDSRRALHDIRGGALTSLIVEAHRARAGTAADGARALSVLVKDQLKVMRNAVLELDDERRGADLAPCPHSIGRLVESLTSATAEGAHGPVRVRVRCEYRGSITMCCVELGALDRAALNLVNNAARETIDSRVDVALVPATTTEGADLRLVVGNPIAQAQSRALAERFGADLGRLFLERYTTTGSGDGLAICADFVSAAYGLARAADAVRAGLVGATVEQDRFVAWLCWPAVA